MSGVRPCAPSNKIKAEPVSARSLAADSILAPVNSIDSTRPATRVRPDDCDYTDHERRALFSSTVSHVPTAEAGRIREHPILLRSVPVSKRVYEFEHCKRLMDFCGVPHACSWFKIHLAGGWSGQESRRCRTANANEPKCVRTKHRLPRQAARVPGERKSRRCSRRRRRPGIGSSLV